MDKVKPARLRKAKATTVAETKTENKYAPKMKVGKPSIKAPGTKEVTTVGLGNLTVITHNANTDV